MAGSFDSHWMHEDDEVQVLLKRIFKIKNRVQARFLFAIDNGLKI